MAETETETKSQLAPEAPHAPAPPVDYHPAWNVLVDDFGNGGLTPAQYAAFALAGIFVILLLITSIMAIHASRRAKAIDAESSQAAIGRWKDPENVIVRSVPEPPRLYKSQSQSQSRTHQVQGQGQVPIVPPLPLATHGNVRKGVGVLGHMTRYSEEGRRAAEGRRDDKEKERERARGRGRSRSRSMDKR